MSAKTYLVVNWRHQPTHGQWLGPWTVEIRIQSRSCFSSWVFRLLYYVFDEPYSLLSFASICLALFKFKWIIPWCFTCFKVNNVWPNPGLPANYSLPKFGDAADETKLKKKKKEKEIKVWWNTNAETPIRAYEYFVY